MKHYSPLATIDEPSAVPFNPDARTYGAYRLGGQTEALGTLSATTLDHATAEATERWSWDRGDRLGIREIGEENTKRWPFDKIPLDRLHIYAVRRSAPLGWQPTPDLMRTKPVYRYKLERICAVDLPIVSRHIRKEGDK